MTARSSEAPDDYVRGEWWWHHDGCNARPSSSKECEDEGFLFARNRRKQPSQGAKKEEYPMADDHDGDADRRERA